MSLKNDLENLSKTANLQAHELQSIYNNDTGLDDEGYWEWFEVGGGKFDDEAKANFVAALLKAYSDGKLCIKD